jgi:predicted transcriptional regulator
MERNISKFLKQKRKETRMTQETFALKAGVGLPLIRALEQETPHQTLDKVNQVLEMFGAKLGVVLESEMEDVER